MPFRSQPHIVDSETVLEQVPRRRTPELPQPLTALIGREREIAELVDLVLRNRLRLVTLTGPGGIGKTRLALGAGKRLVNVFGRDIWFISLAPVADHRLVIPTIAQALGVEEQVDQTILDRLCAALRGHRMLIVLDNVEHVAEAAPELAMLLQSCPRLRVLATGREPLRIHGEKEYAVSPLSLPKQLPDSDLHDGDAVQLFVERAAQVAGGFALSESNARAIHEICRRLDGLPLAIELAAARLKVFSPEALLDRLDKPLAVLTGGPRDAPDRQQTMRNTLQWSYDLLSHEEQQLLRQLSVFSGGCTMAAIEAVASQVDVLPELSSLVDKSLVRRVGRREEETRYDMLEPVRQFALECLVQDSDEARRARQLHAEFFLSTVERLHDRLDGADGPAWFERVEQEHDNLRAALHWARENGQIELGQRFVGGLGIFWTQLHIDEGRTHAETFLSSPGASQRTIERARALWPASWLWLVRNDVETALPMAEEACSIAEEHDDRPTLAHTLLVRGICHFHRDDNDQARVKTERALLLFREQKHDAMIVRTLSHLGQVALRQGDMDRTRTYLDEAIAIARRGDLKMVIATALRPLGLVAEQSKNDVLAFDICAERLMVNRELGIWRGMAESIERIAHLAHRRQKFEHAVCLLGAASVLRERSGTSWQHVIDRPNPEELRSALRAAMPEAEFQAAWEQGRAMAVEEAVELALQPLEANQDESRQKPSDGLTPREVEVLALMAIGRSNREMADEMYLSIRTVERHVSNIYRKIDAHNRTDATRYALQHNIIELANT